MLADQPHNWPLILASASPRRLDLLAQIGLTPDQTIAADIDETPKVQELPQHLALRLAQEKADSIHKDHKQAFILAGDTVVAVGRRILGKPKDSQQARDYLNLLSGRNHRVFTGICVIDPSGKHYQRLVTSRLRFKRLSPQEISDYLALTEWQGKAGGYAIQGMAAKFIQSLQGSYSAVVGLPVYETAHLLTGAGYRGI